jgi:hypothetical protein
MITSEPLVLPRTLSYLSTFEPGSTGGIVNALLLYNFEDLPSMTIALNI